MLLINVLMNLIYITAAWILVILMYRRKTITCFKERYTIQCVLLAFIIFALGETFSTLSKCLGSSIGFISGMEIPISAMSSVLFIVLLMFAFKYHFNISFDFCQFFLMLMATVRIITIIFPGSNLQFYGNVIFCFLGLGIAYIILKESLARYDYPFIQTGIMLLVTMLCTMPNLFFDNNSLIGFLFELAKGIANISIGIVLLKGLFKRSGINMVKLR